MKKNSLLQRFELYGCLMLEADDFISIAVTTNYLLNRP